MWQKVITTGDLQPLPSLPETVIGYQRILDKQVLTVLVNLSPDDIQIDRNKNGVILEKVGNVTINEKNISMSGYGAVVMGLNASK